MQQVFVASGYRCYRLLSINAYNMNQLSLDDVRRQSMICENMLLVLVTVVMYLMVLGRRSTQTSGTEH